jgi:hypothetical protein
VIDGVDDARRLVHVGEAAVAAAGAHDEQMRVAAEARDPLAVGYRSGCE